MRNRALVIIHRGSPTAARVVAACREKGLEPFVVSSATLDGGAGIRAVCQEAGAGCAVLDEVRLSAESVLRAAGGAPERFAFCLAIWDGHRPVMAAINRRLGARDVTPESVVRTQDKYLLRTRLNERGLSRLAAHRVADPGARRALAGGAPHIVKPRRGSGSLFTRIVRSWEEVEAVQAAFARGPASGDLFEEFFLENELILEQFFDGREFSLEMIRCEGRSVFVCEHEKTVLEFGSAAVLERGFASPTVSLSAERVRAAVEHAEAALEAMELTDGCYHVEIRVDAGGACEIVEINPRIGGGLVSESVRQQFGVSMSRVWIDMLRGAPVAALDRGRTCGTYFQLAYPEESRRVLELRKNDGLPAPEVFVQTLKPGAVARGDREDIAAMALWRTDLVTHAALVGTLTANEYVSFVYE